MHISDNAAMNATNFASSVKKGQSASQGGGQAVDPDKDGDNEATETAKAANSEAGRGTNVDTTA
jgi:hypothetical protein